MGHKHVDIKHSLQYVNLSNEDHIDMNNRYFNAEVVIEYNKCLDEKIDKALRGDDSELCALIEMQRLVKLSLVKFN